MKLFAHQVRMVETARAHPRWLYQCDCGTGKTIATLSICDERRMKTLVLAPKAIVESAWCGDARHFPGLKVVPMLADTRHKASLILSGGWDVLVTNYDQFKIHAKDFDAAGVRRLIVDEASKIKTPDSAISKKTITFADRMSEVYLLSANPAPNGTHELWAAMRAVGATNRAPISWLYRTHFPVKERTRVRGGHFKDVVKSWKQSEQQRDELRAALRRCATVLHKSDCLDLPPQLDRILSVRLSPAEVAAYRAAQHELKIIIDQEEVSSVKAGAALIKLRQIVGGAVLVGGECHGIGTAKLDALSDILDEIGPQPVVIWTQFIHERERIERLLIERKETYGIIDGSTSDDAGLTAAMFQDGKLQRLLAHPQAAGHGITLHAASHAVYFALDFSHDGHKQSRDRIHRAGMKDAPATYHYLLAALPGEGDAVRTVDHSMWRTLQNKARAADGMALALREAAGEAVAVG